MTNSTTSIPEKPQSAGEQGQHLVESHEEILGILHSMMEAATQFAAYADDNEEFLLCSILGIDKTHRFLLLGYGSESSQLEMVLKGKSICYVGLHEEAKFQFIGSQPRSGIYLGKPALHIPIPKTLWRFERRASKRHSPGTETIKIILNFPGIGAIEAEAADISMDGIGIIHYHPKLKLEPDLVIDDCEIQIPSKAPIKVKMRIQYATTVQLTDGKIVKRCGCQFLGLDAASRQLLEIYLNSFETK